MSEGREHIEAMYRELREQRDRADAKVKAALARINFDPHTLEKTGPLSPQVADAGRLRISELEARIERLERKRGLPPWETR